MSFATFGINHRASPLAIREKFFFQPSEVPPLLKNLLAADGVKEAVLLSTCNRTEIYAQTTHPDAITRWLYERYPHLQQQASLYQLRDEAMVLHLIRVGSGLDSLILGETQIFKQLKQAYELACNSGTVGEYFKRLFPAIFSTSKLIRHQTDISKNPVTLAYVIVQLTKQIFSKIEECNAVLIGAGETAELMATHLINQGVKRLHIVNRTFERAAQLAQNFKVKVATFEELPALLKETDILITATASPLPLIGKGLIESVLKFRKRQPIFMADLGVPRNIEPESSRLEDVYLYDMDALQSIIQQNLKSRTQAAQQAEAIAKTQAAHCLRQLKLLNVTGLIKQFRANWARVQQKELQKALVYWEKTKNVEGSLRFLSHNLINQLAHPLTTQLQKAACEDQVSFLIAAKKLLNLD